MKPKNLYAFFDRIGVFVFAFLTIDSIVYIMQDGDDLRTYIRLGIGITGFIVDGYLVFFYSKK